MKLVDLIRHTLSEAAPIIVYHGTLARNARSILKTGMDPNPKPELRRWATDDSISQTSASRASLDSSYWTSNLMTAKSSASNTAMKLIGKEWRDAGGLIVIAQIEQQAALADEDSITTKLSWAWAMMMKEVLGVVPDAIQTLCLTVYDGGREQQKYVAALIDKFTTAAHELLRTSERQPVPEQMLADFLWTELRRQLAHACTGPTYYWPTARIPEERRPEPLPVGEAEAERLKMLDRLTRYYRKTAFKSPDDFSHTLRMDQRVGYSGSSRIIGVVQYHFMDREPLVILYGSIPPDMVEQWRSRTGAWPGARDRNGAMVMEPDQKKVTESSPNHRDQLRAIIRAAKSDQVDINLNLDSRTYAGLTMIVIKWISNNSDEPGRAATYLHRVLDVADQNGLIVQLVAEWSNEKLIAYYERFGFKARWEVPDGMLMQRRPDQKKVTETAQPVPAWLHGDLYHGTALHDSFHAGVIYLTPHLNVARDYAWMDSEVDDEQPKIIRCRIAARNPIRLETRLMQDLHDHEHAGLVQKLLAQGHDCAIDEHSDEVCVLDARTVQIIEVKRIRRRPIRKARPVSESTALQAPGFAEWFRGSKVSFRGKPVQMYHGMKSGAFRGSQFAPLTHFGTAPAAEDVATKSEKTAYYMSPDDSPVRANQTFWNHKFPHGALEGAQTFPVYLNIRKPIRIGDKAAKYEHTVENLLDDLLKRGHLDAEEFQAISDLPEPKQARGLVHVLSRKGYDGFVYRNRIEDAGKDSWMIFHPDQVWPAFGDRPGTIREAVERIRRRPNRRD